MYIDIYMPESDAEIKEAGVRMELEHLPEYGQIWVWDLLYSQIANRLGQKPVLAGLREDLEMWAVNYSSKIFYPYRVARAKGLLDIKEGLQIVPSLSTTHSVRLEVTIENESMPTVFVQEDLSDESSVMAVLALAQFFIDSNELFAKELPLHILAFRKFYEDIASPSMSLPVQDAPLFALDKAMKYFNSVPKGSGSN